MGKALTLRPLTAEDGYDVYEMLKEMPAKENGFCNPCYDKSYVEYQAWLCRRAQDARKSPPEGYVTNVCCMSLRFFWFFAGEVPVGIGWLRPHRNDELRIRQEHICYAIRPSMRRRGYSKVLLSLLLDEAAKLGLKQVYIIVQEQNLPSIKAAHENGAKIARTYNDYYFFLIPTDLTTRLVNVLQMQGAALVGFADLRELPEEQRQGFSRGISIAMPWDQSALKSIEDGPTLAYHVNYDYLNMRLDALASYAEMWLTRRDYDAQAMTQAEIAIGETNYDTLLPHKTVATRAGMGWIGKCALLVTREFGSAVRITSILTNAPLRTGTPVNDSACGSCEVCKAVCPAGAVSGKQWCAGLPRDAFWDAKACRRTARERSLQSLGEHISLCGLCILHCPWTQRYLESTPFF